MKRKILAAAAAALLLALVASCSPSPAAEDKTVYGFAEPVTLALSGRDADRFEMKYLGLYVDGVGAADPALRFDIRSLDGNCYTFGVQRYRNGVSGSALDYELAEEGILVGTDSGQGYSFYGQVFREGESKALDNVYGAGSSDDSFIRPKESDESGMKLLKFPYCEPGRYTVTFYAREYVPDENSDGVDRVGSSGDGFYEFGFEFEVPELPEGTLEKMLVSMWETDTGEGEPVALLCTLLYAPSGIRYMQEDTMRFECLDPESGEYVPVDICSIDDRWRFAGGTVRYMFPDGRTPVPWSEAAEREMENANGEDALSFVETPPVFLRGWNTNDLYRFSVDFAEQPDGSGKTCTCSIPLDFSGYDGELSTDFGYTDETIYIGSGGSPALPDGLGDSHVKVKSFGYDYGVIGGSRCALKVVVESDIPLYVTNGEMAYGRRTSDKACSFTKINKDGSETDCGLGKSYTALADGRETPYISPGREETLLLGLPFEPQAGEEYRVTIFFRDAGEVLRTLSFRFRVPIKSSRPLDLVSVHTEELSEEDGTISVQPLIRSNFRKSMYPTDAKLELLSDGQWVEVKDGCERPRVEDVQYLDSEWRRSNELKCVFVSCRFPDRSADCRLTVNFADRWYGGETYTLTLKLRYDG